LFAAALAVICLLYITAMTLPELGWHSLQRPDPASISSIGARVNRAKQVEELFFPKPPLKIKPARNLTNPFYPNPEQPAPPPPAPLTQDVQLVYQGYYQTSGGDKRHISWWGIDAGGRHQLQSRWHLRDFGDRSSRH